MRKLFISVDMEGCAGVSSLKALAPDGWEWETSRRWMTLDAAAAAEAALENGFDEVLMVDGHGNALNIEPDLLPAGVRLIRSWPRRLLQMEGIDDPHVSACAFVGYHAEASVIDSVHAHTYSGAAFRSVRLNGELCSEGYLNAALAGEFDVPVVFVSGDTATVEDMARYSPAGSGFVTKESRSQKASAAFPPPQVRALLKEAVTASLMMPPPPPFKLQAPFQLELEFTTQTAAAMVSWLPTFQRTGAWSASAAFERLSDAMALISHAILYTPNGQPALS